MSDLARNKAAVLAFMDIMNEQGFPAAIASLDEDVTWWIGGAERTKAQMADVVAQVGPLLKSWGRNDIRAITAEEDRVALESVSHADLVNGDHYSNNYHFLFRLKDGRITTIREHADTRYAAEIMGKVIADIAAG